MKYRFKANSKLLQVREKLFGATVSLLIAAVLMTSSSYAWFALSTAPEVSSVDTNISANGALEIALGKNIGRSASGDSATEAGVIQANRTWGNLIDLTDASYGLQEITLLPTILNAAGGAVNTLHPFAHPIYGVDGRVEKLYANDVFTGVYNGSGFVTSAEEYGVRGIGTAGYEAPGLEDTFGPLSQRQEIVSQASNGIKQGMRDSFQSLCKNSQSVLLDYCYYGTDVSASDFNLSAFSERVDKVVSDANQELKWMFAYLAAVEMTPGKNYNRMMDLLIEEYPHYEDALPLVDAAVEALLIEGLAEAVAELQAFKDAADQLKTVIASGKINGSDGYSREEIEQTVGLIFDLEKTNFSIGTVIENEVTYNCTYNNFYSSTGSELYYIVTYHEKRGWSTNNSFGSSVNTLHSNLYDNTNYGYQDNESRETTADNVYVHLGEIHNSLKLGELDQAIASLYVSHWNYWDEHADEYQILKKEVADQRSQKEFLENSVEEKQKEYEKVSKEADKQEQASSILSSLNELKAELQPMLDKEAQLQSLVDENIYAHNDEHLETIGMVMDDTIEVIRQSTLWSIAYFACDGQIADDAYQHMLEIANSSEYIHPRTAYETLCNYGITPADALTQMVISYEKLEKGLLFLQRESKNTEPVGWSELDAELQRIFGTITHSFNFNGYCRAHQDEDGDTYSYNYYNSRYSIEDTFAPTEVIENIRKEIPPYDASKCEFEECGTDSNHSKSSKYIMHSLSYKGEQPWEQALGLLESIYSTAYPFEYGSSEYTLESRQINVSHSMQHTEGFGFDISIGIGSEENFNESGLTVRQTRFQRAQKTISEYQSQLITAAVNMNQDMVNLLMQIIAGQEKVSLITISDYLNNLQQQLEYGEEMICQAVLAMAASDYAKDEVYKSIYSGNESEDAISLIQMLRQSNFDSNVLNALDERMELLENQENLLNQSSELLNKYKNPQTGAWEAEQISTAEAVGILNPVLDADSLTLYSYVEEQEAEDKTLPPNCSRTVLYTGFGSPAVKIEGNQVTVGDEDPMIFFGDVYLSMERSLSGSLLAFAKTQVETYTAPEGSISADDIIIYENSENRKAYPIGTVTVNLCTVDTSYAVATSLWTYTGNTSYISADNELVDIYGYCIDISLRSNVENSNLLLQTDAVNRISDDGEANTDTAMGAGSYMEFTIKNPLYSVNQAKKYMECLRVTITDTNTGYIYGYASMDMSDISMNGTAMKAPLRLYDKNTGIILKENDEQYLCHLTKNAEKNLTIYVYLDGAKATDTLASAYDGQSLQGMLNLQFTTDVTLKPANITNSIKEQTSPPEAEEVVKPMSQM